MSDPDTVAYYCARCPFEPRDVLCNCYDRYPDKDMFHAGWPYRHLKYHVHHVIKYGVHSECTRQMPMCKYPTYFLPGATVRPKYGV